MTRNVIFAVLGVLGLVLKPRYSGLPGEIVYSYGGNVSVSFAVYFVIVSATLGRPHSRILAASIAMVAVTIFEITNGFGFMENVYDPLDILANAVGIGLAAVIDIVSTRLLRHVGWVDYSTAIWRDSRRRVGSRRAPRGERLQMSIAGAVGESVLLFGSFAFGSVRLVVTRLPPSCHRTRPKDTRSSTSAAGLHL